MDGNQRNPNHDIFVFRPGFSLHPILDQTGINSSNLTKHIADDNQPDWSPDGNKIAFVTDRDGNAEIYSMNADGTQPTNLTKHPAYDFDPSWSPDGKYIAFIYDNEIYIMDPDGKNVKKVIDNKVLPGGKYDLDWDPSLDFAPNKYHLAFTYHGIGDKEIYSATVIPSAIAPLNSFSNLTNTPKIDESQPNWVYVPESTGVTGVSPKDKLPTLWGKVKSLMIKK